MADKDKVLALPKPENPVKGLKLMKDDCRLIQTYGFVLLGNIARWVWLWAEAALAVEIQESQFGMQSSVAPGSFTTAILPRVVISLIISALVVAAFWPRLRNIDESYRKWVSFAFGFFAEPTVGFLGQLFQLILGGT